MHRPTGKGRNPASSQHHCSNSHFECQGLPWLLPPPRHRPLLALALSSHTCWLQAVTGALHSSPPASCTTQKAPRAAAQPAGTMGIDPQVALAVLEAGVHKGECSLIPPPLKSPFTADLHQQTLPAQTRLQLLLSLLSKRLPFIRSGFICSPARVFPLFSSKAHSSTYAFSQHGLPQGVFHLS